MTEHVGCLVHKTEEEEEEGREGGRAGGIKEMVYNINRAQHGNVIIPFDALCLDCAQCVPRHIDQGNAAVGKHNQ